MDVSLALTHDCNLNCSYCYAGAKRREAMTRTTAWQALDFAFSFQAPKLQLGFFGGEPLLEWPLLQACAERAEALAEKAGTQLRTTVTTNGTLLTEDRVAWLHKHAFYPAISLDGNRAMHDATRPFCTGKSSFDATIRGLRALRESFPEIEVIVVPEPANVAHLADSIRYLVEEEDVIRISINPNFYTPWDEDALDLWRQGFETIGDYYLACYRDNHPIAVNFIDSKVITRLKNGYECQDRCNFGEREIAVAPSGNVYPCERLIGEDLDHTMVIGNVFEGFNEKKRQAVLAKRGNINGECIGCGYRPRCMNWCCCINYTLTGAIDQTDGIVCFHERAAIAVADRVGETLFNEKNPCFLKRFYYEENV
ncbi:MAG: radical SAM protein [Lentisphaeria bacterium]|nr:radical SAM protein [Lentisphaeria bacterium]